MLGFWIRQSAIRIHCLITRPVTLDEVQRAPQLLLAVKRAVDEQRRAGDFVLTESANLLLMGQVADTLAGRAIYLELPPFCPAEWLQRNGALDPIDHLFAPDFDLRDWPNEKGHWQRWLLRGGFPPAVAIEPIAIEGCGLLRMFRHTWSVTCDSSATSPACPTSSA